MGEEELMIEASPSELGDLRAANSGLMLADFECKHGRLPEEGCLECEETS